MNPVWFHLELDSYYYGCVWFKPSSGMLFGISNILSLGWGKSRTHFSKKEKNEKKVDNHVSKKKNRKKKKNQELNNGLIKKRVHFSVKNKRQIVIQFYPSCLN